MLYILVTCRLLVSLYMIDMYTEVRDIPLVSQLTPSLPLDSNVGMSILTDPRLHGSDNEKSNLHSRHWMMKNPCWVKKAMQKHETKMNDLLNANQI